MYSISKNLQAKRTVQPVGLQFSHTLDNLEDVELGRSLALERQIAEEKEQRAARLEEEKFGGGATPGGGENENKREITRGSSFLSASSSLSLSSALSYKSHRPSSVKPAFAPQQSGVGSLKEETEEDRTRETASAKTDIVAVSLSSPSISSGSSPASRRSPNAVERRESRPLPAGGSKEESGGERSPAAHTRTTLQRFHFEEAEDRGKVSPIKSLMGEKEEQEMGPERDSDVAEEERDRDESESPSTFFIRPRCIPEEEILLTRERGEVTLPSLAEMLRLRPQAHRLIQIGSNVDDFFLRKLPNIWSELDSLTLDGNDRVTFSGIRALLQSATQLKSLRLIRCNSLFERRETGEKEDARIEEDPQNRETKQKGKATIHHASEGATHAKANLAEMLQKLEDLSLSHCRGIDDTFLSLITNEEEDEVEDESEGGRRRSVDLSAVGFVARFRSRLKKRLKAQRASILQSAAANARGSVANLSAAGLQEEESEAEEEIKNSLPRKTLPLKSLDLSGCRFGDTGLRHLLARCPDLETLRLSSCSQRYLTSHGLRAIPAYTRRLTALDLSGCFQLSSRTLRRISKNCKKLRRVALAGCAQIEDSAIVILSEQLQELEIVDLSAIKKITSIAVSSLGEKCKKMRRISLIGCPGISEHFIASFKKKRPRITVISGVPVCTTREDRSWITRGMPALHPKLALEKKKKTKKGKGGTKKKGAKAR